MRKFTKVLQLFVVIMLTTTIVFNFAKAQNDVVSQKKADKVQMSTSVYNDQGSIEYVDKDMLAKEEGQKILDQLGRSDHQSNMVELTAPRVETAPYAPSRAAIWTQMTQGASGGKASQDFEAGYDAYDCMGADDFTLTEAHNVDEINWIGVYWNGYGPAESFNFFIYADAGGMPGALLDSRLGEAYTEAGGIFNSVLSAPFVLNAGTYWISIQARMDFALGGQFGWEPHNMQVDAEAYWINPGGGFGSGTDWVTYSTVWTDGENSFAFELVEGAAGPPANDACSGAIALTGEVVDLPFNTTNATDEGVALSCVSGAQVDIWYVYTAPVDDNYTISLCGSAYDTGLGLWDDCGGTELACNDDACGVQSELIYGLTAGQVVYIQVGGYNGNTGTGVLNISYAGSGPANDDCANAEAIGWVTDLPFSTTAATADSYDCMTSPNIWYNFTAPEDAEGVIISLCGSDYDTYLGVYDSHDCGTMVVVECNDDACGLQSEIILDFPVTAGEMYKIEVGGYSSNTGDGILNVYPYVPCVVECPPEATDEGEPCGTDTNGGCNSDPNIFGSISDGETICGNTWDDGSTRDTDWYEFTVSGPSTVTLYCESEIGTIFGKIGQIDPGVPGCANTTGSVDPYLIIPACTPSQITFDCPVAGTYYAFVAQDSWYGNVCPGSTYVLSMEVETLGVLEGYLTYFNNGTPMDYVSLDIGGYTSVMTDVDGHYGPVAVPEGTHTIVPSHAKPWANYQPVDLLIWRSFIATGNPPLEIIQQMAGDVDGNGLNQPIDALFMAVQYAQGVWQGPSATTPDWLYYNAEVTVAGTTMHDFEAIMKGDIRGANIPEAYVPPAGIYCDACSDVTCVVNAPFPVTGIPGSTIGATDDMAELTSSGSGTVWATIELPYANNQVTIDLYGTNLDNAWIVALLTPCDYDSRIYTNGTWVWNPPTCENIQYDNVPGPGFLYAPFQTGSIQEDFTVNINVTEM